MTDACGLQPGAGGEPLRGVCAVAHQGGDAGLGAVQLQRGVQQCAKAGA